MTADDYTGVVNGILTYDTVLLCMTLQEWVSPVLLCAFVLGVLPISFSYLRHHAEVYEIFKRRCVA